MEVTLKTFVIFAISLTVESHKVSIEHNPYHASILLGKKCKNLSPCGRNSTTFICSGSLISLQTAVTSASRFFGSQKYLPQSFYVRAGTKYRNKYGILNQVKAIVYHDGLPPDGWSSLSFDDYVDLALVMVAEPFPLLTAIKPLNLPEQNAQVPLPTGSTFAYTTFSQTGLLCLTPFTSCSYEYLPEDEKYSIDLNGYLLTTLPVGDCSFYQQATESQAAVSNVFHTCANNDTIEGLCARDAGALVRNNTIYGVYSHRKDVACMGEHPATFNYISPFVKWIKWQSYARHIKGKTSVQRIPGSSELSWMVPPQVLDHSDIPGCSVGRQHQSRRRSSGSEGTMEGSSTRQRVLEDCGAGGPEPSWLINDDLTKRLTGGDFHHIEHAPYHVAVLRSDCGEEQKYCAPQRILMCSGGLISFSVVLTAGSCFFNNSNVLSYFVSAGSQKWTDDGEIGRISEVIFHDGRPRNGWTSVKYGEYVDLAVIILRLPFPNDNSKIAPLNLPQSGTEPDVGWQMSVTGWENTFLSAANDDFGDLTEDRLRSIKANIISTELCRAHTVNPSSPSMNVSAEHHMCIDTVGKVGDTRPALCKEDVGASLVRQNIIYGVYSFQNTFCNERYPAVFTKVAPFIDWIQEMLTKV